MRGTQAAEIVPLHGAGKTLTDRGARHVHFLTFQEVFCRDFLANDVDQVVFGYAELGNLAFRLDLGCGEVAAHGLADALDLGRSGAQLNGGVAILVRGALGDDLKVVQLKNGHRDLLEPSVHGTAGSCRLSLR